MGAKRTTKDTNRVPLSVQTEWPGGFGNWSRWPNERGTLNLITPAKVLEGIQSVGLGKVITCAGPLRSEAYPESLQRMYNLDPYGYIHEMYPMSADAEAANDKVTLAIHRRENAHIDALSHVGHQGRGFNGLPFTSIVDADGAHHFDISQMLGIVTRAKLVDVPKIRGISYMEAGDYVTEADLEAGAADIEPGDGLLIRTGKAFAPASGEEYADPHGASPGLGIDAMRFVADRDVAVLGTDSTGDTYPLPFPGQPTIHELCEVYLGLPLLHGLDLEDLAAFCHANDRGAFLFMVSALHIVGGTGSPVTPVCVL